MTRRTAQAGDQPDLLTADKPAARTTTKTAAKPAPTKIVQPKQEVAVAVSPPAKIQPPPPSMIQVIARAAADPKLDAEKMRALLDMQKEIVAEEARLSFVRGFRKLRQELPTINRDGKIEVRKKDRVTGERTGEVQQTTYFASFENLMDVCEPIFLANLFGFWTSVEPTPDGSRIIVVGYLDHDEGHQRQSRFPLPAETSGSKNNVQGWGSSTSYGKRYNAVSLLNIRSRDPRDADNDGNVNRPTVSEKKKGAREAKVIESGEAGSQQIEGDVLVSDDQLAAINAKMIACKVPLPKVLEAYGIERLQEIPASKFDSVLKSCDEYKKRLDAKAAR